MSNSPEPFEYEASRPNCSVDCVIHYRFDDTNESQAQALFLSLIESLQLAGLATEVRLGDADSFLVFVKMASEQDLKERIYRSRIEEWLYDAHSIPSSNEILRNLQEKPVSEAERLRIVYSLITSPKTEGGLGLTPKEDKWKQINSIFLLHDRTFNQKWVKRLGFKYFLNGSNLSEIKDQFGEKIAFYFAFLQAYLLFLIFPAVFGFFAWLLLDKYSPVYAIFNGLWCVIYVEYWKMQEEQLAVQWGMNKTCKNIYKLSRSQYDSTLIESTIGNSVQIYVYIKRLSIQLLQIPFAVAAIFALGGIIATCFAIEIFISEIYNGPFKSYLVLLPTIVLSILLPTISALLTRVASKLTDLENYKSQDTYEASMIQKVFVLNFITSYLPLFLTAFVYVPFGQVLVPYFNLFHPIIGYLVGTEDKNFLHIGSFRINKDRLTSQVIYFTVTAQIINFALEALVPFAKRKLFSKFRKVKTSGAAKCNGEGNEIVEDADELPFLIRARCEANMEKYNVTSDFREMVVQFGYLSLFSVVWPLAATSFLVNNLVEIRSDAMKIAMETQRPVPRRAESIGPWLNALGFLAWLGSFTTSALVYLFSGDGLGPNGTPWDIKGWGLLLTILLSENLYMVSQSIVRKILSTVYSFKCREMSSERLKLYKASLQEKLEQEIFEKRLRQKTFNEPNKIRTNVLENSNSLKHNFWNSQPDPAETIEIWKSYISKGRSTETKKEL